MRYLALPELEQLNALLSNIECDDGSRITGRLEAYSCKAAGADKKLWRRVESRFHPSPHRLGASAAGDPLSSEDVLGSSPPHEASGMNVKLLYYLIATMNLVFPDYDFSDLPPETFHVTTAPAACSHVNTTLFNTGLNKNVASFAEFSGRMWECVDRAIGLEETAVYSFSCEDFDAFEDPFWDRGCIWSFNYFFWNRRLKRMLLFTCRAVSDLLRDSDTFLEDRLSQISPPPVL